MYVVCVTVHVKDGHADNFLNATLDNARNTRKESGNVRFDVLQAVENPNQFFLYEVYREEADFRKHQQTEHYLRWKQTVKDWMAQPRQGIKYHSIFPESTEW
ncbi:antibiotic biosynthesis monooxygenase [candidate division KSB1 bacterium]|nr:antibiotic biosynthesis monooxygenase [bacterium]OQX56730.1 MAG: antibiotic biosynthesis monooxygenase [candidate division KSB1 bacterium 4484_219]RKY75602.1 MAG: antibiotic biosynthesis monooxygenase [candidate division KSB1 bacterium]RKY80567.1 MAG: antibiotic biosynthesis monooxygenase [candidate division KSB1 bacterium]RKY86155.1 MAG: antibiotic biosynthesis monooxygenase [candidate division KSB1 bacterium]